MAAETFEESLRCFAEWRGMESEEERLLSSGSSSDVHALANPLADFSSASSASRLSPALPSAPPREREQEWTFKLYNLGDDGAMSQRDLDGLARSIAAVLAPLRSRNASLRLRLSVNPNTPSTSPPPPTPTLPLGPTDAPSPSRQSGKKKKKKPRPLSLAQVDSCCNSNRSHDAASTAVLRHCRRHCACLSNQSRHQLRYLAYYQQHLAKQTLPRPPFSLSPTPQLHLHHHFFHLPF